MGIATVVVGVGNRMKGDDGIGPVLAERLRDIEGVLAIDAGTTPENYIQPIVEARPGRVLFIDACTFGGNPGEFEVFPREDIDRLSGSLVSTHTLPLSVTVALLGEQTEAEIHLLGVQPESIGFNQGLSRPVAEAVAGIVEFVKRWLES